MYLMILRNRGNDEKHFIPCFPRSIALDIYTLTFNYVLQQQYIHYFKL